MAYALPNGGTVYADKGYCAFPTRIAASCEEVHLCAIKKNNMKEKDFDLDRYTFIRSPFERVLAQSNNQIQYVGLELVYRIYECNML